MRIRAELADLLKDWRDLLAQHVVRARKILRKVLTKRIRFTADTERYYGGAIITSGSSRLSRSPLPALCWRDHRSATGSRPVVTGALTFPVFTHSSVLRFIASNWGRRSAAASAAARIA